MKQILLSQGKYTLVDDELFNELNSHKWTHMKGYAIRFIGGRKNPKCLYMHREILGTPDGMYTDHIDHNGLNNQKSNLRIVNKSQNMVNCNLPKNNVSGYKGIYWDKNRKKWRVQFIYQTIGRFNNLPDAIKAREESEKDYWLNLRPLAVK